MFKYLWGAALELFIAFFVVWVVLWAGADMAGL